MNDIADAGDDFAARLAAVEQLLRETLAALNAAPGFRYRHEGDWMRSYALAARIERALGLGTDHA